jgi:flagellar motor switch protein FliG
VQAILKHIERDDLITALKGASPTMVDKFLSNVSRRAAEDMRDEMEVLGMVPKFRARTAQENIVAAAMKLADEGTIYLPMWADAEEG